MIKEISMAENLKQFGEMMSEAMEAQGMSIRTVAQEVGLTYEYVRSVAAGKRDPKLHTVRAICKLLGIKYEDAEKASKMKKLATNITEVTSLFADDLQEIIKAWNNLKEGQRTALLEAVREWGKAK